RWAGREQRAFGLQNIDVEGVDGSRCGAETYEHAEWLDAVQRGREGFLAHAVIDHLAQFAAGDLLHLGDEIFIAVEDDVMRPVLLGELGLVLGTYGADHIGTEIVRPLAGNEA